MDADLPRGYFDGVFVSNVLEHLPTQDAIAAALARLRDTMTPGGTIAVMGPNFRYCAREYFDCADHVLALTHIAVTEHLHAAGFSVGTAVPPVPALLIPGPVPGIAAADPRLPAAHGPSS